MSPPMIAPTLGATGPIQVARTTLPRASVCPLYPASKLKQSHGRLTLHSSPHLSFPFAMRAISGPI